MQPFGLCPSLKRGKRFALVARAVSKVPAVIENFVEVVIPAVVHHRAMGKNECAAEPHILDHL